MSVPDAREVNAASVVVTRILMTGKIDSREDEKESEVVY